MSATLNSVFGLQIVTTVAQSCSKLPEKKLPEKKLPEKKLLE
ncbi:MAG: hypothetical protein AAFR12_11010 [Cyanobacteria bacterium J06626_6]